MTGLDYITIEGFKSIASIEQLALRPINILIGANGSGKSNFLEAFSLLKSVREGKLEDYVIGANGAREILHFGPRTPPQIRFEIGFGGDQFAFTLNPDQTTSFFTTQSILILGSTWDWENGKCSI